MEHLAAAERRSAAEIAIQLGAVTSVEPPQSHRSRLVPAWMEWPALLAYREGEPPWLRVEQVGQRR